MAEVSSDAVAAGLALATVSAISLSERRTTASEGCFTRFSRAAMYADASMTYIAHLAQMCEGGITLS